MLPCICMVIANFIFVTTKFYFNKTLVSLDITQAILFYTKISVVLRKFVALNIQGTRVTRRLQNSDPTIVMCCILLSLVQHVLNSITYWMFESLPNVVIKQNLYVVTNTNFTYTETNLRVKGFALSQVMLRQSLTHKSHKRLS